MECLITRTVPTLSLDHKDRLPDSYDIDLGEITHERRIDENVLNAMPGGSTGRVDS